MKARPNPFRTRIHLAAAVIAVVASHSAQASTYYWDVNGSGTTGFSTVVGAWNNTSVFWNTSATGTTGGTTTAVTTAADDLIIPQATTNTGSITLSGAAKNASSITFAANVGPTTTVTGGGITIGGTGASSGIFNLSSGANTIATGLTLNPANTAFNFSNSGAGLLTIGAVTGTATAGNVTQTITVGSSRNGGITINGAIADVAGSATKVALVVNSSGWGITTLSGLNTFTGTTSVTGGTLRVTGSTATGALGVSAGFLGGTGTIGGAVTLSGTGGIKLTDGAVGTLSLGSTLDITGAAGTNNLFFDLANAGTTTDKIAASGAFSMATSGAGVVAVNQLGGAASRLTAGTYDLITAASGLSAANFSLVTTKAFGQTFSLATPTDTALKLTTTQVTAATAAAFWAGSTDINWSAPTNWRTTVAGGGAVAGAPDYRTNVTFATTTPSPLLLTTNVVDADFDINSLTFNSLTGGVTIGGSNMLTLEATNANGNTAGNGITSSNTSGTNSISARIGLASSQTWTVATGGSLTVSGAITDFGSGFNLTKAGAGTLTLNGSTTLTGSDIIVWGETSKSNTLQIQSGANISARSLSLRQDNVTNNTLNYTQTGGGVTLTGDFTLGAAAIAGASGSSNNATLSGGTLTANGMLALYKWATSTLTVSNAATVNAASLRIGWVDGTPTGTINLGDGTNFSGGTHINDGGTSGILKVNAWDIQTVRNYTLNFKGGTLKAGAAGASWLPASAFTNARVQEAGGIIDNGGYDITLAQVLSHGGTAATDGGLVFKGTGITTLSGVNTYTGATTINGGTLSVTADGTISASSPVTINNGGTLLVRKVRGINTNGTLTINDGGTLHINNDANNVRLDLLTLDMTGGHVTGTFFDNIYWGLSTPTINIHANATPSTIDTVQLYANAGTSGTMTFNVDAGAQANVGGIIRNGNTGATSLAKAGEGTLSLTSNNSYTGTTTVTAGTLLINGNISTSVLTTVSGTGTLGGAGIVGTTEINAGGTLSPGNSIDSLNIEGDLTLGAGSFSVFEINTAGNISDLAIVSGLLTFGGTLNVNNAGATLLSGDIFDLFNWGTISGTFSAVSLPDLDPGLSWDDTGLYTSGTITVIPEPRAALLGGIGILILLRRRRVS